MVMYTTGDKNKCEIHFFIDKYTVIPLNPNTPKVGFDDEGPHNRILILKRKANNKHIQKDERGIRENHFIVEVGQNSYPTRLGKITGTPNDNARSIESSIQIEH
uniref:Uncharacterized protein n=1 Tax=Cucumis melo TaxID=3656 RepID=Q5DMW6_CUCME|nr:hypothetical protein [Cucumis melo]